MPEAIGPKRGNGGDGWIAALDIGTTQVRCLIARDGAAGPCVVGSGLQASQGVRNGLLVDLDAAAATIQMAVAAAERMAGVRIPDVVVNVPAGAPRSQRVASELAVAGHAIGDAELQRLLAPAGFANSIPSDQQLVHVIPVGYALDGRGVSDPRGRCGQRLSVKVHLVTASAATLRHLASCLTHCRLEVAGRVVSPYAAALGCLAGEEMQRGVTLIDLGGGTTSVAVFADAALIHTDRVPLGGLHVTRDLARGLSTPMPQAERLKTRFGSCQPMPADAGQTVEVPPIADDGTAAPAHVPRSRLVGIIRPRMAEIFETVRARLQDAGLPRVTGRRTVLTGGACQLPGTPALASRILGQSLCIGRPRGIAGLPETAGPAFAACAGLLRAGREAALPVTGW